jgi:hypothetical protein
MNEVGPLKAAEDLLLTVSSGKQCRRDIDKNSDWCVSHVCEGLSSIEDQGDESRSQVSCEIGADCNIGESPHHVSISEADYSIQSQLSKNQRTSFMPVR